MLTVHQWVRESSKLAFASCLTLCTKTMVVARQFRKLVGATVITGASPEWCFPAIYIYIYIYCAPAVLTRVVRKRSLLQPPKINYINTSTVKTIVIDIVGTNHNYIIFCDCHTAPKSIIDSTFGGFQVVLLGPGRL